MSQRTVRLRRIERPAGLVSVLVAALVLTAACGLSGGAKSRGSSPAGSPAAPASSRPGTVPASGAASPVTSSSSPAAGPAGGPVPARFTPRSTSFVSASLGWVLGNAPCATAPCTSMVRTRDGGRSWHGVPAPRAPLSPAPAGTVPPGSVQTVRFADQSNGWVAGRSLYATHDGGGSWHRVSFGAGDLLIASLGTAGGRVYAVTETCTADNECAGAMSIYTAAVGSDSWTKVTTVGASNRGKSELTVVPAGWYLPVSGGVAHGTGTGVSATLPSPCSPDEGPSPAPSIAVVDAQHLDAMCGRGGAGGSESYQVYGSTDGGRHWKVTGAAHRLPSDLDGLADNGHGVLLAAASSGESQLVRTTDDGQTLPPVLRAYGGGIPWVDLGFTTPDQAVAVLADSALYLSRDAGRTWAAVRF